MVSIPFPTCLCHDIYTVLNQNLLSRISKKLTVTLLLVAVLKSHPHRRLPPSTSLNHWWGDFGLQSVYQAVIYYCIHDPLGCSHDLLVALLILLLLSATVLAGDWCSFSCFLDLLTGRTFSICRPTDLGATGEATHLFTLIWEVETNLLAELFINTKNS